MKFVCCKLHFWVPMLVLVCCLAVLLAACGDSGETTASTAENTTLIKVAGTSYSKYVAQGSVLTLDTPSNEPSTLLYKPHEQFDYYEFTASDGTVYYSDDGQKWKRGLDGEYKPLRWKWDMPTCEVSAHYVWRRYTLYFADGERGSDEYKEYNLGTLAFGEEMPALNELLKSYMGNLINSHSGFNMGGFVCLDTTGGNKPEKTIANAQYSYANDYKTLNGNYYLDDINNRCTIGVKWVGSDFRVELQDFVSGHWQTVETLSVQYEGTVSLSYSDTRNNQAIVGWATEPNDLVVYAADARYKHTVKSNVVLYAVRKDVPKAPIVSVRNLELSVDNEQDYGPTYSRQKVHCYYADPADTANRIEFGGNFADSVFADGETYQCFVVYAEMYDTYRLESPVTVLYVRPRKTTVLLGIADDTLVNTRQDKFDDQYVRIVLDGVLLDDSLADQPTDLLTRLDGGKHTVSAYYDCRIADGTHDVIEQSLASSLSVFVRDLAYSIEEDSGTVTIQLDESVKVGDVFDATCSLVYYYGDGLSPVTRTIRDFNESGIIVFSWPKYDTIGGLNMAAQYAEVHIQLNKTIRSDVASVNKKITIRYPATKEGIYGKE